MRFSNLAFRKLGFLILLAGIPATPLWAQSHQSADPFQGKTVEKIVVSGLKAVDEPEVLHQLKSKVGAPYTAANLDKDRENLDKMAVFSRIAVDVQPGAVGVVILVDVKETSPYLPYPSINVTGEQGLTLGAGFKSTNFLGSGAYLAVAARFGGANEFDIISTSAWRPPKSLWWKVDYFYRDRDNELDHFHEDSNELDLQAGQQVTDSIRLGGNIRYLSVRSDKPNITLSADNKDIIPGIGVVAEWDTRDSVTNTKRGWWNSADASANGLGADGNYWTFNIDVRRYQPISGRHSLAVFSLLSMQTGEVGTDIPIHEDFHIGGTNSVRGWDINARNGKDQWLNTVEYRYELVKVRDYSIKGFNFYAGAQLAVFADSGTAWNSEEDFSRNFIGGAGIGIRLVIPYVSLVRLDFGFGQPDAGVFSHFGIMEKAVYQKRRIR